MQQCKESDGYSRAVNDWEGVDDDEFLSIPSIWTWHPMMWFEAYQCLGWTYCPQLQEEREGEIEGQASSKQDYSRPIDPLLQDSRVRQQTSYSVDTSSFSQGYRLLRRPGWETHFGNDE
jgi:hypothetical protein